MGQIGPHGQMVMDDFPFPSGQGFNGATQWWQQVASYNDSDKLDQILGLALLDQAFCGRLLAEHDCVLLEPFGLTPDTSRWLQTIQVQTLQDLAVAIIRAKQESSSVKGGLSPDPV